MEGEEISLLSSLVFERTACLICQQPTEVTVTPLLFKQYTGCLQFVKVQDENKFVSSNDTGGGSDRKYTLKM